MGKDAGATHGEHCICYGFLERRIGGEDGDRDSGAEAGQRASYELFSGAMRCWVAFARWSLYVCVGIVAYSIALGLAGEVGGCRSRQRGVSWSGLIASGAGGSNGESGGGAEALVLGI